MVSAMKKERFSLLPSLCVRKNARREEGGIFVGKIWYFWNCFIDSFGVV
jgi:hypothetical protein